MTRCTCSGNATLGSRRRPIPQELRAQSSLVNAGLLVWIGIEQRATGELGIDIEPPPARRRAWKPWRRLGQDPLRNPLVPGVRRDAEFGRPHLARDVGRRPVLGPQSVLARR